MFQPFLIAGFPRCRTAWFSVACQTAQSDCIHEPTAHTKSFEDLEHLWHDTHKPFSGFSDSALTLQLGPIMDRVRPRTLLVERPLEDVLASLQRYFGDDWGLIDETHSLNYLLSIQKEIDAWRRHPLVQVLQFKQLSDLKTIEEAMRWLMPGLYMRDDLPRLMQMNIQAQKDYVMRLASRPHNQWYRKATSKPCSRVSM